MQVVTKEEFESTIVKLIAENKFASALLMIESYIKYYPEEKVRLEEFKQKIQGEYYKSDEYLNMDLPF